MKVEKRMMSRSGRGRSLALRKSAAGMILKELKVVITKKDFLQADSVLKEDRIRRRVELEEQQRFDEQRHQYKKNYTYQLCAVRKQVRDLKEQAAEQEYCINDLENDYKHRLASARRQLDDVEEERGGQEEYIEDLENELSRVRKQLRDLEEEAGRQDEYIVALEGDLRIGKDLNMEKDQIISDLRMKNLAQY